MVRRQISQNRNRIACPLASAASVFIVFLAVSCAKSGSDTLVPTAPGSAATTAAASASSHGNHHSAAGDDKGYIDGWFDGQEVQLYYTRTFFCDEPPASGAPTNCVLGADAEIAPRPGNIRTIYAIAPAGFVPDLATLACAPGSVCLNHPAMIDASRVAGPGATNVPAVPHSHIVDQHGGGWRHTVNIRVFSQTAWNEIAAAKSLAKVRELQGDPATGRPGVISADTPTNIFFFIASWR
jgi:hypothetical protein